MYKKIIITVFLLLITAQFVMAEVPVIGLVYSAEQGVELQAGKDKLKQYRDGVEKAGGRIAVISEDYDSEFLNTQLEQIDGLLLPGGIDIDPANYNEENTLSRDVNMDFDRFELSIIEYALKKQIPILAICRGHQLINIYHGGSLYQDIPAEYEAEDKIIHQLRIDGKTKPNFHYIKIEKDSLLYELLKVENIRVNSTHHQAVKEVGEGLEVIAEGPDGIVESMVGTGDCFILTVQFHPERVLIEDPRFYSLFEKLIEEAIKYKKQ